MLTVTGTAKAAVAGSSWNFPLSSGSAGEVILAPNGSMLEEKCVDLDSAGNELWRLPPSGTAPQTCADSLIDSEGNAYVFAVNGAETEGVIESVTPTGQSRWSTPTGAYVPGRTKPVLGANGDVYFSAWNGLTSEVIGVSAQTGAVALERGFADVTGLYAYADGLIVINTDSEVVYTDYAGNAEHEYSTGSAISAYEAYSSAGGAGGAVFVAGYEGFCGSTSHASIEKFTTVGHAWTWTDPAEYCAQTTLSATPDGGVVFGRAKTNPSADFTSVDPNGNERWSDNVSGPTGTAEAGGYFPVWVAVNGVVALTARIQYPCAGPRSDCPGALVEYLSEADGTAALPRRVITTSAEEGFVFARVAFAAGRTYVSGETLEGGGALERALFAFSTPGLERSYTVALQEALTASGPPAPPPRPPPTLPVTIANGGGGGVAGAPDPGSLGGGGPCDPGANTNWLHIAGVTFTCILSGDVWNDPTLLSAKKKCIINIGTDVLPFAKLLKAPKYIKEADSVEAAIRLAAKETAGASYPGKASGDARAVAGLETTLKAVRNPKQALLTILSSDRVLDGLIAKLGKGGGAAAKVARDLAVLKSAITTLVETVSGVQDVKACTAAFRSA
jgi:hypothetical protein